MSENKTDEPEINIMNSEDFNKLSMETMGNNIGIYSKVEYEDPCVNYFNPDINNKHKNVPGTKINIIKFMK